MFLVKYPAKNDKCDETDNPKEEEKIPIIVSSQQNESDESQQAEAQMDSFIPEEIENSERDASSIDKLKSSDSFKNKINILKEQVKMFKYDYTLKKKLHQELMERFSSLENSLENNCLNEFKETEAKSAEQYVINGNDDNEALDETFELLLCEDLTLNNEDSENIDTEFETNYKIVAQNNFNADEINECLPLVETIKLKNQFKSEKRIESSFVKACSDIVNYKEEAESDLKSLSSIEGSLKGILIDDCNNKNSLEYDKKNFSSTPLIHLYPKIGKN